MKKCLECKSERIIKDALALDRSSSESHYVMWVAIDEKPDALMFKNRIYSDVKADVCGDCGFIQYYAKDPERLWLAYQKRKNNVT